MKRPRVPLGDVAEFINGLAFKPEDWSEDGRQIVRIQNLTDSSKPFNRTRRLVDSKYEVSPGELLVSWSATLGVFQWPGPDTALVNQHIFRVAPASERITRDYLRHMLSDALIRMESHLHGATMKHVNRKEFLATEIPLPPLPEQKRIAAILDTADTLRAKRRESIEQLDSLIQATFLEMFGDPVTNPKGWDVQKLGDICDVRDGTHDSPKYVDAGFPLLTSKNFASGQVDYTGAQLISEDDYRQINKRSNVDIGDLVMPMIGTIGNPVLITSRPDFAIKNVALIKFAAGSPDQHYLRALLCSTYFDHVTAKANRGGTQKFIALKDLRGLPIPTPTRGSQQCFASIVESIEQQKARLKAHLAELDTLFASLQSRAFNGELVA